MASKKSERDRLRRQRLRDRLINDGVDPKIASAIARGHTPKGYVSPTEQKRFKSQNIAVEVGARYRQPAVSQDPELVDLLGDAYPVYDKNVINDRFTGKAIRQRHRDAGEPLWTPVYQTDPRTGAILYDKSGKPKMAPNQQWLDLMNSKGVKEGQAWTLFFS